MNIENEKRNHIKITLEGEIDNETLERLEKLDEMDPEKAFIIQDFITDMHILGNMMLRGWEIE